MRECAPSRSGCIPALKAIGGASIDGRKIKDHKDELENQGFSVEEEKKRKKKERKRGKALVLRRKHTKCEMFSIERKKMETLLSCTEVHLVQMKINRLLPF